MVIVSNVGKAMPQTTHDWYWFYSTYKNGDDLGMAYGLVLPTL